MTPLEQLEADFARVKQWRKWKLTKIRDQAETLPYFIIEEEFALKWIGTEDLAVATTLYKIYQVYTAKRKELTAKDTIEDSSDDDLDDDDADNAPKGPPSSRGKQIVYSSSSSDKETRRVMEKSRLETQRGGESSKAPQEQLAATLPQGTQLMDLNMEPHQEEIPKHQATTSEHVKNQILTDGAEDTPTLAEVFINERRATIKFVSNAELRLHKRLIKM
ncbi:unnamed protein product [Cuscuta europaea]|uniref:Uncharacterized protein n=1 Tax=Cuscuta europaea TaxID=41803 RepID=A0A9P1E2H8_CUSEU|nr:unnamed protein product [Cuscuta europaea]